MVTDPAAPHGLLERAGQARAAGRGEVAARLYGQAAVRYRDAGDLAGWTEALLGAASVHLFGVDPGKLPAQLYDVLARTTDDTDRARLGAALARCWVYAGHADRAARFAGDALAQAERTGAAALLADCLDAALTAHWGPDDVETRRRLTGRLGEVAAHVLDPDVRLQAHLWGLHVACEALDVQAMHRHLRALDRLGEESARARFFAASRRLVVDLMRGRSDTAAGLADVAAAAGREAGLADAWMVVESMRGYAAAQAGDAAGCAAVAAAAEAFGLAEGVPAVCAEAAYLWCCAGEAERAAALLHTFGGRVLDDLPRDVNWLLTLQCLLEVALAVGDHDMVRHAAALLTPYPGRAVVNTGAVMFHGVTDDPLSRAAQLLGDTDRAAQLRQRALAAYERAGASWWQHRLSASPATGPSATAPPSRAAPVSSTPGRRRPHLHPGPGGLWLIGPDAVPTTSLRGFDYLRELLRRPGQPIAAADLAGARVTESGLGELADRRALAAYRQRLRDLDEDLDEAAAHADTGRTARAQAEREALLAELGRATGLHGRPRTGGSSGERARVAVTKAITAAIDRIATIDPPTARHLRTAIHTGLHCRYHPDPDTPTDWIVTDSTTPPPVPR
jgi:hypothetical protein